MIPRNGLMFVLIVIKSTRARLSKATEAPRSPGLASAGLWSEAELVDFGARPADADVVPVVPA